MTVTHDISRHEAKEIYFNLDADDKGRILTDRNFMVSLGTRPTERGQTTLPSPSTSRQHRTNSKYADALRGSGERCWDLPRSENQGGQDVVRKVLGKIWSITLTFMEKLSSQLSVGTQTQDFFSESRSAIQEVNELLMLGLTADLRPALSEEASTSFSSEL